MTGTVVQVSGSVVDVYFKESIPKVRDALYVEINGKRTYMEVEQHVGDGVVRCIMLGNSEGLGRDFEVVATGAPISVPVGKDTLGRIFNVLGETIDGGEQISPDCPRKSIHSKAPSLRRRVLRSRSLRPVSKSSTFWSLIQEAERSVCLEVQV